MVVICKGLELKGCVPWVGTATGAAAGAVADGGIPCADDLLEIPPPVQPMKKAIAQAKSMIKGRF